MRAVVLPTVMPSIDWGGMWRPERSPWETALRALVVYLFVHVGFRLAGRKELGRHATYDIVLLFFVGVAMRQTIVGDDPSLTTAMIGFGTLLVADFLIAWLARRSPKAALLIDGPVRELVRDGRVDEGELRRARMSVEQLLGSLRRRGADDLDRVRRACLERSGHISFILREPRRPRRSLPRGRAYRSLSARSPGRS